MSESPKNFKDHYDEPMIDRLAHDLRQEAGPDFDADGFKDWVVPGLGNLEMKGRARRIADGLARYVPGDFESQLDILLRLAATEEGAPGWKGFGAWPFTMFVADYGLEHFDRSLEALRLLTTAFSAEFAIRPFIEHRRADTIARLMIWSRDQNHHVRRLVSEGTRPRLPWGGRLRELQDDPSIALPLLERLKDDDSEYVRRSVANHLNDISKDHPDVAVAVARDWHREGDEARTRLVKHGLRTLVKAGDARALHVLGYQADVDVAARWLRMPKVVHFGQPFRFEFELVSNEAESTPVVVDYVVHHVRKSGDRTPKTFKLKTTELAPGEPVRFQKKHVFKPITTRRYYPGEHRVELQVNGKTLAFADFELEGA